MSYDQDFHLRTKAPTSNAYSTEEVSSIVSSTTGTTVTSRQVDDKQLDDLMSFVFGDIPYQEDSYDY